jgi:hypothetical protein
MTDTRAPLLPVELTRTAWPLEKGRLTEVAHASDEETFGTERPFPMSIRPAALRRQRFLQKKVAEPIGAQHNSQKHREP